MGSPNDWQKAIDLMARARSSNRAATQHMEAAELALAECLKRLEKALNNSHECGEKFRD